MAITKQKNRKTRTAQKPQGNKTKALGGKQKQAIEKAIQFWKQHSVDMTGFVFNREEANAR